MDAQKEKRVDEIAIKGHQVVMREELDEKELDEVIGGVQLNCQKFVIPNADKEPMKGWWFF